MAAPSRVQASALSAIQETTVALASINFDFSLFRVDPPSEYKAIGNSLSPARREAAESGSEHVVARKLHALFAEALPSTPHLFAAYGSRTTEIVESEIANPRGRREDGILQDWVGADATSIWAAATSGRAAIAVHLLACLLARLFSASEATAIWEEIVLSRKTELSAVDASEPLTASMVTAVQVEITRQQLSSWDASARAWLTVADKAKQRQQTQTMLLIKNSVLPVSQKMNVYPSVMEAWTSALVNLDKIVSGIPCNVTDGAVLLALGSWHIYPDIHVLTANKQKVNQADALVATGGLVTLGASSHSPDLEGGVYWSLPLAYLRFYGDPVLVSRNLSDNAGRLSRLELLLVTLGSVFSGWKKHGDDIEKASILVLKVSTYLFEKSQSHELIGTHWLQYLTDAAEGFLSSKGVQREHFRTLIDRGRRRYGTFLCDGQLQPSPMFDISTVRALIDLITEEEKRIEVLRFIAASLNVQYDTLIIRYKPILRSTSPDLRRDQEDLDDLAYFLNDELMPQDSEWEYASAIPPMRVSKKRKWAADDSLDGYVRFTERSPKQITENTPSFRRGEHFTSLSEIIIKDSSQSSFIWEPRTPYLTTTRSMKSRSFRYKFMMGNPDVAAIFRRSDVRLTISDELDVDILARVFEHKWIDHSNLMQHLESLGARSASDPTPAYMRSLRALAAGGDVYKLMPNATVSTSVFRKPLHEALWTQVQWHHVNVPGFENSRETANINEVTVVQPKVYSLSRTQAFACIAMFENRIVDLDPATLKSVLAISAGNSIYIAMSLTCDPIDQPRENEMKHITGNVGKPGISLLIPPSDPKVRKQDNDVWSLISHKPFDEKAELGDSFQTTSLHLSFTRYELPASVHSHGTQDVEARFMETLVSIFDRDEWVADVDVLKALGSAELIRRDEPLREDQEQAARRNSFRCKHKRNHHVPTSMKLTLIDSWIEMLDRSETPALFRAEGNKYARLAAVVLSIQLGHSAVLFKDRSTLCWRCIERQVKSGSLTDKLALSVYDGNGKLPIFIC